MSGGRPGRRIAAIVVAVLLLAPGAPAAGSPSPSPVRWEMVRPHMKAAIYVVLEGLREWGLLAKAGDLPEGDLDRALREIAVETLTVAHDDIAWSVGEVFNDRLFVSTPMKLGDVLKPRPEYIDAILSDPEIVNPLKRYLDAILRSKGMKCADCLDALPAARDVSWPAVRTYIEDFVNVSAIDPNGRVDLHIATAHNRIPEYHSSDHNLAAAVYAAMHLAIRSSPGFAPAVQDDLNQELTRITGDNSQANLITLNTNLPARFLKDPRCLGPILAHLPEALERHSLHCVDCPQASP